MKASRKNQTIKPSFEAIQLCTQNGERLFADAQTSVSMPTKGALLELSLEEISKAYVLLYQYVSQKLGSKGATSRYNRAAYGRETEPTLRRAELRKLYAKRVELQDLLRPMTVKEFRSHEVKLERLIAVIATIKAVAPAFRRHVRSEAILEQRIAPFVNWQIFSADLRANAKAADKFLSSIKEAGLRGLPRMKETGFYVDFVNGKYLFPTSHPDALLFLEALLNMLIRQIRFELGAVLLL